MSALYESCGGCGAETPSERCIGCLHDFGSGLTAPSNANTSGLAPCPFCGGEAWLNDYEAKYSDLPPKSRAPQCRSCGASLGYLTTPAKATEAWNRRVTAASAQAAIDAEKAKVAELKAERDQIAGESIWWKTVIGDDQYTPSGEVPSIRHLHPAMVRPVYEAHKGTAVADVIAGLIFSRAITENREQFLVGYANDRATAAEARNAEVSMLAYRWMEAHDRLKAGLDYDLPTPADLPNEKARADRLADIVRRCVTALDASRSGGEYPDFEEWEKDARAALQQETQK